MSKVWVSVAVPLALGVIAWWLLRSAASLPLPVPEAGSAPGKADAGSSSRHLPETAIVEQGLTPLAIDRQIAAEALASSVPSPSVPPSLPHPDLVVATLIQRRYVAENVVRPALLESEPIGLKGMLDNHLAKLPAGLSDVDLNTGRQLAEDLAQSQFAFRIERLTTLQSALLAGTELPASGGSDKGYAGTLTFSVESGAPWNKQGVVSYRYFLKFDEYSRLRVSGSVVEESKKRFGDFLRLLRN